MTPTSKLTTAQKMSERLDKVVKENAEQFALALTKTLSLATFFGKCKCGLALTERDKSSEKRHHSCPRCGWTGEPRVAVAAG